MIKFSFVLSSIGCAAVVFSIVHFLGVTLPNGPPNKYAVEELVERNAVKKQYTPLITTSDHSINQKQFKQQSKHTESDGELLLFAKSNITHHVEVVDNNNHNYDDDDDDDAVTQLLSNVLAVVAVWHNDKNPYKEYAYLGHTLGSIVDWKLVVGELNVVIVTNNATGVLNKLEVGMRDIIQVQEVNLTGLHGNYLPFFHRNVIDEYILKRNHPTAYAFFEEDTVTSAEGLVGWARDTIFLERHRDTSNHDYIRHFFRWEWNKEKGCVAHNSQTYPVSMNNPQPPPRHKKGKKDQYQPSTDIHEIGGRKFVSLSVGKWAGMYVVTHAHMEEFYNSDNFWTKPIYPKLAREIQLHSLLKKDADYFMNNTLKVYKDLSDTMIVPLDKSGKQLDMIAGVHHQSDKYARTPYPFGKLCLKDTFVS